MAANNTLIIFFVLAAIIATAFIYFTGGTFTFKRPYRSRYETKQDIDNEHFRIAKPVLLLMLLIVLAVAWGLVIKFGFS